MEAVHSTTATLETRIDEGFWLKATREDHRQVQITFEISAGSISTRLTSQSCKTLAEAFRKAAAFLEAE